MSPFLHVRFPAVDSSRTFFRFHLHTQTTSLAMHYKLAWDLLPISREPTSVEPLLGGAHAWVTVWVGRARDRPTHTPPSVTPSACAIGPTMVPRCWPRLAPCHSADHAAIVLEHGCRLDHVRERRHLLVAEHLLEHREPSACLMAVGGGGRVWGCDANTFWQNLQLAGSPDSPADFRKSSKKLPVRKRMCLTKSCLCSRKNPDLTQRLI